MTLTEMHVMFRQFAQQMGLQNVRAILPEQIDLLINTSISDTVNQIIQQNIGVTNDRIVTDNSKISQINALRTLYKVTELDFAESGTSGEYKIFRYSDTLNPLFWVDFSIAYDANSKETHWFPIRLIDDIFLADVLNDFILKPTLRSPAMVMTNGNAELYIGNIGSAVVKKVRAAYVSKPVKVKYLADMNQDNIDCDLPHHLHVDIVKHAVELWQIAVNGSMATEQARQQRAQQQRAAANRNENN